MAGARTSAGGTGGAAPPALEPLAGLGALGTDGDRGRFFAAHPRLLRLETLDLLCEQINRTARADVDAAERQLATAGWLARRLGDATARGRQLRASANLLLVKRELAAAVAGYEAAWAVFEGAGDRREVVRTLSTGLAALTYLGEFERAMEWAEKARRLCAPLAEPQLRARLDFNVGHALAYQDRSAEALTRFQSAHRHFLQGGRTSDVAVALRNIAVCQQQLNRFEAALEAYREARDYCRRHGLERLVLKLDYNIAYLYFLRGEYTRASRSFDEVRQRCAAQGDRHHAALCDLDEAEILLELNLFEEAGALARAAGAEFGRLEMPYEAAKALTIEALAVGRGGAPRRADELLRQAHRSFAGQDNRYWAALTQVYRAQLLEERDPAAAARLAAAGRRAFVDIGLAGKIALCELLQARLALVDDDLGAAQRLCRAARRRLATVDLPALEYRAHLVAGLTAESAGRRDDALADFRRAESTLERLRGQLQTDELKIGLSGEQQAVYQALFALELAAADDGERRLEVFEIVQRAKSRSLADLLATRVRELRPRDARQAGLVEEVNALRAEASWCHREIDLEESRGAGRSLRRVEALRAAGRERERRLLRSLRRLQHADPELGALQGAGGVPGDALRAALPADTQVLEYFTSRGVVHVCLLDGERLSVRPLCEVAEVRALQRSLQHQIGKFLLGREHVERLADFAAQATNTVLERLHGLLVGPVSGLLRCRNLIVAPHGPLHQLPFHAFRDGDRWLLEDHCVAYAPSATVHHHCARRRPGRGEGALVLGVPDARAPLIGQEAGAVAELLPGARLLLGEEASLENLARHGAGCRIVHIATHGLFRRDNPMFSAIRLGGSRLSLFDLYNLRLEADLVVLSGCSTGLSALHGADELVGLTRGLLHAGARAVLATLWDVNDESASRLMTRFYRQPEVAAAPAEALRRAQRELRREYAHPYHWAPFVLVGAAGGA